MKITLIIGVVLLLVGLVLGFLSGATNGPNLEPLLPLVYGTNQILWLFMAVVGLIMTVVGIIGLIVKAVKKNRQPTQPV